MSTAKVAISLPRDLLARVDALAIAAGESRSAFIRSSLERTLRDLEEDRAVREARAIYEEIEQDPALRRLYGAFAGAASETVPPFDAATVPAEPAEPAR